MTGPAGFSSLIGRNMKRKYGFGSTARAQTVGASSPSASPSASPRAGNPFGIGGQARYDQTGRLLSPPGGSARNVILPPEAYPGGNPGSYTTSLDPSPFPVVGYPSTGWNPSDRVVPPYQTSIPDVGMVVTRSDRGGPGDMYNPIGGNIPLGDENVSPNVTNNWLTNGTNTDATGNPLPMGGGMSGAPAVSNPSWIFLNPSGYPIPGGLAPGQRPPTSNWAQNARSGGGGGWAQNARGGYQPWQQSAIAAAAARGYGPGDITRPGGGEWATVSSFPGYSGFLPAGSGFGNVKYLN